MTNTLDLAAASLRTALEAGTVPVDSTVFAASLLAAYDRGRVSDKQAYWLVRLTTPTPAPVKVSVATIVSLITGAVRALKHPKITLWQMDGSPVVFKIAGAGSRHRGSVMITDGGAYGSGAYYGRISPDGELFAASAMTPDILNLVIQFSADPAGVAAAHGRRTGHCCFCTRELSTRESLAVGYGPICAQRYELPWG